MSSCAVAGEYLGCNAGAVTDDEDIDKKVLDIVHQA